MKVLPMVTDMSKLKGLYSFLSDGFSNQFSGEKISFAGQNIKLKIFGYDDINLVLQFKGCNILVDKEKDFSLKQNEYLVSELLGSQIIDGEKVIGKVNSIENFGATDILVLELFGKEKRVPFVLEYFDEIKPNEKKLIISKNFFEGVV